MKQYLKVLFETTVAIIIVMAFGFGALIFVNCGFEGLNFDRAGIVIRLLIVAIIVISIVEYSTKTPS